MDHKTWLWKKKPSEKMIVANENIDFSARGDNEVTTPTEKEVDLERSIENLNEKLASVLSESAAKDELVTQHVQMEKEAIAGREDAEAKAVSLKKELDEVSKQRAAANERLTHLNAALKESMKQLSVVREEHEQRIHEAVMKTSKELEKSQIKLEEKYTETSRRLASLIVENTQLSRRASHAESEFNTLMARFDSTEKENAFLKYEFRVLEKELEIRNEEIKFNRQSADALRKQHLESVKGITKLESECQRLRVLLRKRSGPGALVKMRSEVEMQGRNQFEMRRKRNPMAENSPEIPSKKINLLIERLCSVEEENKFLKEILVKKDDELHDLRSTCAQSAPILSDIDDQFVKRMELACCSPKTSSVDVGNDDKSSSRSWTSTRISEPDRRIIGVSDISLMDDFVEMEKLAIVSVDSCFDSSYVPSDTTLASLDFPAKDSSGHLSDATGKELVPVAQIGSDESIREHHGWLRGVLEVIMDQNRVSKRTLNELLEDIRMGLSSMNHSSANNCDLLPVSGYITWKSPNSSPIANTVDKTCNAHISPALGESITKIIKLIEEVDPTSFKDGIETPVENSVGVFLQETNESSSVPQTFVHTCYDLLQGKADLDKFARQLESALDWIVHKWITSREVSSISTKTKDQVGFNQQFMELEKELEGLKESKAIIEDQIDNQKLINEDLDTQLTVSNVKLNEVLGKLSSLEVELEEKRHCCEELEAVCLELQLQLESVTNKGIAENNSDQEGRLLKNDMDITVASAKLAECQKTILQLGKQLKALTSPKEASKLDTGPPTASINNSNKTDNRKLSQRSTLRERMLAEDIIGKKIEVTNSQLTNASQRKKSGVVGDLAIVPSKKLGRGGFLRKLLLRKNRGSTCSNKSSIFIATKHLVH